MVLVSSMILPAMFLIACGSGGGGGDGPTPTYNISGQVTSNGTGLSGVTITLSGNRSDTTTTNSNGDYSFSGLSNGSYTVTPSLTGYTFDPTSRNVTISGADVSGVDFTAAREGGLFPNNEEEIKTGELATITDKDGYEVEIVSKQIITEFTHSAINEDYTELIEYLTSNGLQKIGQIPDLFIIQIEATSNNELLDVISYLKTLPYIQGAYLSRISTSHLDYIPESFEGDDWIQYILSGRITKNSQLDEVIPKKENDEPMKALMSCHRMRKEERSLGNLDDIGVL